MNARGDSPAPQELESYIGVERPARGVAVVVLGGEHDLSTAPDIEQVVSQSIGLCSHLIIDLSPATFIDSSVIRTLVNAKKHADSSGRRFNLVFASSPTVERVLEITGVLETLNRVTSVEQALRSDAGVPEASCSEPS